MISTISVTVPFTDENLKILSQLTPVTECSGHFKAITTVADKNEAAEVTKDTEAAIKPDKNPEGTAKQSTDETETVSKTDVRALALKLSKAGKADDIKAIFAKFGGNKLSDINESDYPELKKMLEAVNLNG